MRWTLLRECLGWADSMRIKRIRLNRKGSEWTVSKLVSLILLVLVVVLVIVGVATGALNPLGKKLKDIFNSVLAFFGKKEIGGGGNTTPVEIFWKNGENPLKGTLEFSDDWCKVFLEGNGGTYEYPLKGALANHITKYNKDKTGGAGFEDYDLYVLKDVAVAQYEKEVYFSLKSVLDSLKTIKVETVYSLDVDGAKKYADIHAYDVYAGRYPSLFSKTRDVVRGLSISIQGVSYGMDMEEIKSDKYTLVVLTTLDRKIPYGFYLPAATIAVPLTTDVFCKFGSNSCERLYVSYSNFDEFLKTTAIKNFLSERC